jgi:hypothetical protein
MRHVFAPALVIEDGQKMKSDWTVRVGLCAAAAVLAASLGILILQNVNNGSSLRTIGPAQIQSSSSVAR